MRARQRKRRRDRFHDKINTDYDNDQPKQIPHQTSENVTLNGNPWQVIRVTCVLLLFSGFGSSDVATNVSTDLLAPITITNLNI